METMEQYIKETPEQCRKNIFNAKALTRDIVSAFMKKPYKRIEIIASGSSYNGAMTAKYFIEKVLKMKVEVLTSFTVLTVETILDVDVFYVGMGQSGRSTNTNAAMEKIRNQGFPVFGVTGNVDSVMKYSCDAICSWEPGIEKIGYVTKGYSTSVLFWMLFAVEAAHTIGRLGQSDYEYYIKELLVMTKAMDTIIPLAKAWVNRNIEDLKVSPRIQVIGYGSGLGAALEGTLKIEETYGKAASCYELEEFMHGPCYEITEAGTVIVLDTAGKSQVRAQQLFNEIHCLTSQVYMITGKASEDEKVLTLPQLNDETMNALVNVIALQLIGAYAHQNWINPNLNQRIAFCEAMNVKAPKTGKEIGL